MTYSPLQYARALYDLTAETSGANKNEAIKSFASFLQKNNALHLYREIGNAFSEYARKTEGLKEISIKTANEKAAKKISSALHKNFVGEVIIDPNLIAGVSVTIDDIRVDNSIKNRLSEIRKTLTR